MLFLTDRNNTAATLLHLRCVQTTEQQKQDETKAKARSFHVMWFFSLSAHLKRLPQAHLYRGTCTVQGVPKMTQLVLSKLRQFSTKFDNFWHTDSKDDKIMW